MKFIDRYPWLCFGILAIITSIWAWGDILWHPNSYLFNSHGDGIKNYFTPLFHIKHGQGTWFTGINYPYGEHVVFTDNQPLIAVCLAWVHQNVWPVADYSIGILNILLILSLPICALFTFKLLRYYYLPTWYALPFAFVIAYLSPQLHRFGGHYALGYTFFIPLVWWLLVKATEKSARYQALLLIFLILFAFIHVYYLLIGCLFVLTYHMVAFLQKNNWSTSHLFSLAKALFIGILPIVGFQILMYLSDPTTGRPSNPYGFLQYYAQFESVFLPIEGPYLNLWNYFIKVAGIKWEGFAYVGTIGLFTLVFTVFRQLQYGWHKRWNRVLHIALPAQLLTAFWASTLLLIFAMALPFRWGLEFLVDFLGPLKQFRSLGRFAWLFYYVFSVYTVFYFYLLYKKLQQKRLYTFARWMLFVILLIWTSEAFINIKQRTNWISGQNKELAQKFTTDVYTPILADLGYQSSDFQAIMYLPFTLIGSEKIGIEHGMAHMFESFKLAYDTGLPLVGGMSSRNSIPQAMRIVQPLSSDYVERTVFQDYKNDLSLLVALHKQAATPEEQNLIEKSILLGEKENTKLYRLPLDSLRTFEQKKAEVMTAAQQITTALDSSDWHQKGNFFINKQDAYLYTHQTEFGAIGKAIQEAEQGPFTIFEQEMKELTDSTNLQFSFWVKTIYELPGYPVVHYVQYNKQGQEVVHQEMKVAASTTSYKGWQRITHYFQLQQSGNRVKIYLDGEKIVVSNFMIQSADADVCLPLPNENLVLFNNYYFTN